MQPLRNSQGLVVRPRAPDLPADATSLHSPKELQRLKQMIGGCPSTPRKSIGSCRPRRKKCSYLGQERRTPIRRSVQKASFGSPVVSASPSCHPRQQLSYWQARRASKSSQGAAAGICANAPPIATGRATAALARRAAFARLRGLKRVGLDVEGSQEAQP